MRKINNVWVAPFAQEKKKCKLLGGCIKNIKLILNKIFIDQNTKIQRMVVLRQKRGLRHFNLIKVS